MKRMFVILFSIVLLSGTAMATSVTHQETGEKITYSDDTLLIYGDVYYHSLNPQTPYRNLISAEKPTLLETRLQIEATVARDIAAAKQTHCKVKGLERLLDETPSPLLENLTAEQQIALLLRAFGVEGNDGQALFTSLALTEEQLALFDALVAGGEPALFTDPQSSHIGVVRIDGKEVPYLLVMLEMNYADGSTVYERYTFFEIDGVWLLSGITQSIA